MFIDIGEAILNSKYITLLEKAENGTIIYMDANAHPDRYTWATPIEIKRFQELLNQ